MAMGKTRNAKNITPPNLMLRQTRFAAHAAEHARWSWTAKVIQAVRDFMATANE